MLVSAVNLFLRSEVSLGVSVVTLLLIAMCAKVLCRVHGRGLTVRKLLYIQERRGYIILKATI